jgi:hypothetical protein
MIFRPLQDGDTEQNIIDECKSLIDNMNHHFNHDGFMNHSGFGINKEEYYFFDETAFNRRVKLEKLGL